MASPARPHVEALRRLVREHAGLDLREERTRDLAEILGARVRATGAGDAATYLARLGPARADGRELARILEGLVVNETYFFRDRAQLDVLASRVFPELAARGGRIRILSAGASTGAEAYTLAILLCERFPELVPIVDIVGIDLVPAAIEVARRGRWLPWTLRDTPAAIVARYFEPHGRFHELRADVRAMVSFEVRNLLGPEGALWAPGAFDVIFCRNVLMYLAPGPAQAAVARLERSLTPGGCLFLGHAETLRGFATGLALERDAGAFYYRHRPSLRAEVEAAIELRAPPSRRLHIEGSLVVPSRVEEAKPGSGASIREVLELVERGDLAEAENACALAHAADDLDAVPYYLMALCRDRAGDPAGARRRATAAAYLDPTFAMPCLHLGLLARRDGDFRTARRELERAVALLAREDDDRLHLLGGGLDREALRRICHAHLSSVEVAA